MRQHSTEFISQFKIHTFVIAVIRSHHIASTDIVIAIPHCSNRKPTQTHHSSASYFRFTLHMLIWIRLLVGLENYS